MSCIPRSRCCCATPTRRDRERPARFAWSARAGIADVSIAWRCGSTSAEMRRRARRSPRPVSSTDQRPSTDRVSSRAVAPTSSGEENDRSSDRTEASTASGSDPSIPIPSRQPCTTQPPKGERRAACGSTWSGFTSPLARANAATSSWSKRISAGVSTYSATLRSATSCFKEPTVCSSRKAPSQVVERRSVVSSAWTSRICVKESQPATVLGRRLRVSLDLPPEHLLEAVHELAVKSRFLASFDRRAM